MGNIDTMMTDEQSKARVFIRKRTSYEKRVDSAMVQGMRDMPKRDGWYAAYCPYGIGGNRSGAGYYYIPNESEASP